MLKEVVTRSFARLQQAPENIDPRNYGFYVSCNYAALFGFLLHFIFIPVYLAFGFYRLAAYNLVCICAWPIALYLNLKGYRYAPLILANAEVLFHATYDTIVSGYGTGFIYYIMVLPFFIFLAPWRLLHKILLSVLNATACGLIYYYPKIKTPDIAGIYTQNIGILNISNLLFMFCMVCLGAFFYRRAILKIESELESTIGRLNEELAEAADYVRGSLPNPIESIALATQWEFIPSASLGGDAFGYHWVDDKHFAFYLLDVSGHGVGAALLSVSVMNALRSQTLPDVEFCEPDQVLRGLNRAFPAEKHNDMFFTIWYGVYCTQDRQITYASAGHHAALLFTKRNAPAIELKTVNVAIGALSGWAFQKRRLNLEENSCIYVFSDGVYEFMQADGTQWRFSDFGDFLRSIHQGERGDLVNLVNAAQVRKRGGLFEDDFTILKITFN